MAMGRGSQGNRKRATVHGKRVTWRGKEGHMVMEIGPRDKGKRVTLQRKECE